LTLSLALPPTTLRPVSFGARSRRRLAALLLATALVPAAMPLLPDHGGFSGISRAFARENIAIDKIDIPTGFGVFTLNKIAVTGSSLSRAEFEGLFKTSDIASIASLMEKFDAEKITIASITGTSKFAGSESMVSYNGITVTNVRRGVIGEIVFAGAEVDSTTTVENKGMAIKGTYGRMSVAAIDVPYAIKWYTTADPSGAAPVKRIYGANSLESMRMTGPMFEMEIGRISSDFLDARLPRTVLSAKVAELSANPPAPDDVDASGKMFPWLLDVYAAFTFGKATGESASFKGKDSASPFSMKFGKMEFGGGAKPFAKIASIEGGDGDAKVKVGEVGFTGDIYGGMLIGGAYGILLGSTRAEGKGLKPETRAALEKAVGEANKMLAKGDLGFSFAALDIDAPAKKGGPAAERVKATLASFSALAGNFVAVTPTKIGLALKNFKMPLPANSTDAGIKNLKELGIETLDLTSNVTAEWTESTSKVAIREISVDIDKFAKATIKGELAGVPRALFEQPTVNWPQLLATGNVQSLSTEIVNRGGLDKLVAKTAREQGQDPAQFRAQIGMMAPAMIGAVMAGHPDAVKLADAVSGFLKSLGSLAVTVKSVSPGGVTVPEIMGAAGNPVTILPKLAFEATGK
jgi:hypothetical protein